MEFLKIVRRRSFLSEVVYTVLNIALALGVVLIIYGTQSPWLALGLVILSKWRVLAVRPRYWFVNVQANLVDFIVSISLIVFLYTTHISAAEPSQKLFIMGALTLLYIGWLLFLKPRSKRIYVAAQAGVALFSGTAALFMISYAWPASAVVLLMWLIGYTTARHILSSYDETHILFLSLLWGLFLAELGWVGESLFIAVLLGALWTIGRTKKDRVSFTALVSFLAVLSLGLFDHYLWTLQQGRLMLFLSISLIAVIYQLNRERVSNYG